MFTPELISQVLVYGAMVIAAVQLVKRAVPKLSGVLAVVVTAVAGPIVCLPTLNSFDGFPQWVFFVIIVVLEANGLFQAFHTKK